MTQRQILTIIVGLFLALSSSPSEAKDLASLCPDLQSCAKAVGAILGQKYVYSEDLKGSRLATPGIEVDRDNAEYLFTHMLYAEGYSRVPLDQPGTFEIQRQRDARDAPLPILEATINSQPRWPNNWDLAILRYKAKNPEVVEPIARMARSFMPANSRIIPIELSGTLLVTDSPPNMKKLYELIRDADRPVTPEMKRRWAQEEEARRKERLAERMNGLDPFGQPLQQQQPPPPPGGGAGGPEGGPKQPPGGPRKR